MAEEQNAAREWAAGGEPAGARLWERESELQSAERAVDRLCREFAAGGTKIGELLVFFGRAGIGKTSVLEQVRRIAGSREGSTVLFARGSERQRKAPFRVLRQLLLPVLNKLDADERTQVFGNWYSIVAPAVGLEPPSGEVERIDPQGIHDGLDFVITQLAPRKAPLVVVVDDLHAADQESLTWLASFALRARELPVLLAFAYRDQEFEAEAEPLLRQIQEQAVRRHELRPLNPVSVAEIVHSELAGADDAFCRQVWAVTAGAPYDTVALLREVHDQNLEPVEENSPRLRDLAAAARGQGFDYWIGKLGPAVIRFAWAAALIGTEISEDLAAAISAQGPAQAAESVRELRRLRILTGQQPNGKLEFVHPLIATSLYQSIPHATRTGMHGQAAIAIENSGGSLLAASRHLLETHPGEGDDVIVRKLRRAAAENLAIGAPEAARRCLERALNEPPDEDDRAEVLYELACAALLTDPKSTANLLRQALDIPDGLSPDLRVEAVFRLSEVLAHGGELDKAAALCQDEAAKVAEGPGKVRLTLAHLLYTALQRDEEDGPGRAAALARLAAEVDPESDFARPVRALLAWDLALQGDTAEALRAAESALVNGRLPAELGWTNTTWNFELPALLGLCYAYNDELARAEKLFSSAIMEFEIAGWSGAHRGFAYFLMGFARLRRGFLPEAEDFLRRGLKIADRMGKGLPLQWNLVCSLIDTLLARGRDQEAWEIAKEYDFAPPYHPTALLLPDVATVYGKLLISHGEYAQAAEVLEAVGARLDRRGWHSTVHAPWVGHLAVAIAHRDRDLAAAREYGDEAVARARRSGSASALGAALRLAASVWEGAHAVELLQEAVAVLGRSPAGYEHAHALVDLGAALVQVGRSLEAAEHLYQGMELAKYCGADGLEARAREVLAASGLRPSRVLLPAKDALNPEERQVAELAARALPPQRIAERLDLPLALVKQRLAAVHRKLGTGPGGLADALGLPTDGPGQAD